MNLEVTPGLTPGQLPENINKLFVAYSGGIDSSVLMHVLLPYKAQYQLVLWHINHGLQANSQSMEGFARHQAELHGLEFRLDRLNMDPSESNLEAKARSYRYRLFENALSHSDALLTAHHKNDQAETLLLNLMRGSGATGLRAIARFKPLGKGLLWRPLIDFTRLQIEQYAADHQLEWIEDPSNRNIEFDRNFLRHQVLPALTERWPSAISQLQRVSELQVESDQLQNDLAVIDFTSVEEIRSFTEYSCISVTALTSLSFARQKNLIRYWLKSNKLTVIGFHKIEELLKQLHSRADGMPIIEGENYQIRLFKQALYIVLPTEQADLEASYTVPQSGMICIPQIQFCQSRLEIIDSVKQKDNGQKLFLKFRQVNQQGVNPGHSHTLKRLFQKHRVPPWKRSFIPQIYFNDELIGLWI